MNQIKLEKIPGTLKASIKLLGVLLSNLYPKFGPILITYKEIELKKFKTVK